MTNPVTKCPFCHSDEELQFDTDGLEPVDGHLFQLPMICDICGSKWNAYLSIKRFYDTGDSCPAPSK